MHVKPRKGVAGAAPRPVGGRAWRRVLESPAAVAGAAILAAFVLCAMGAPLLTSHSPVQQNLGPELAPPQRTFPLGLDSLGRDVLSRLIFGSRISLLVGCLTVAIALTGGVLFGVAAGYYRGWPDAVLMRMTDALFSFPPILLAMALMASFGPSIQNVTIALGIVYMPRYIRLVRVGTLAAREEEYVTAARAAGGRDSRVLRRHILPNLVGPIAVQASFSFGEAIIAEAALSFLGIGTQPPTPSWGLMLADAREYLVQVPWYPAIVGSALVAVVLAVNLVGDGVRDILDPRLL
jgi:peptide/nickel transport system permease protein